MRIYAQLNAQQYALHGSDIQLGQSKNGVTAAEVTSSSSTEYSWLSDKPGAKKRSVNQRTKYTRKQFITDARRS